MTPQKIFFFGLCVIAIIFGVSEVIPEGTRVGEIEIRTPDYRKWIVSDTLKYRDISAIIASVDTTEIHFEQIDFNKTDSIAEEAINTDIEVAAAPVANARSNFNTTIISNVTNIRLSDDFYPFEYPPGMDTLLYPFFRTVHQNRLVRVLHYGDSQIEADRISSTIRNHFQMLYGGRGPGFLPIVPVHDVAITFQHRVAPGWKRFSVLDRGINALVPDRRFGVSGNFVRYEPVNEEDTVAAIGLTPYYGGFRNARTFTDVRLFYGTAQKPFTAVVFQDTLENFYTLNNISHTWWRFESPQNSLDLQLITSDMPDIYGIALDGERGVAVDNLPLRGSSGLDFSRMDTEQMRQMLGIMDVELLILQFGANIVTRFADDHENYSRRFALQLQTLKSLKPGLMIIVVGVNDISENTPEGYVTRNNVENIRNAQKKAAFEAGCVFWDLFESMGGQNSMPSWVFAEPPLAQTDFMHFTPRGARIVGELFCKAWTWEHQKFNQKMSK